MEKDIQDIKISLARIETSQVYMKEKLDRFPVCEKEVIKERLKIDRKLIYILLTIILGSALTNILMAFNKIN